jgi:hypothetical protein
VSEIFDQNQIANVAATFVVKGDTPAAACLRKTLAREIVSALIIQAVRLSKFPWITLIQGNELTDFDR